MSRVVRVSTGPLSGGERKAFLDGFAELRDGPDPDAAALLGGPWRVVGAGPDWLDVEVPDEVTS